MKLQDILAHNTVARLIYYEADSPYTVLAKSANDGKVELTVRYGRSESDYYMIQCPSIEAAAKRFYHSNEWHRLEAILAPRDPHPVAVSSSSQSAQSWLSRFTQVAHSVSHMLLR